MNHNLNHSRVRFVVVSLLMIYCLRFQLTVVKSVQADQPKQQGIAITNPMIINGCSIFLDNNVWNAPIDNLPVHPRSDQWINSIGRYTGFHMDFGSGTWAGGLIGIPYNIVGAGVPKVPVSFYYPGESDSGPYPLPQNPLMEYGSDHHILIVDSSTCTLYELYDASYSGGSWHAGSGAIWSLNSNTLRPDTWTSADAAGLPILPGLVRYDEIVSGEINHAIRFTAQNTNGYIWPARHLTSNNPSAPQIPPMGARFRLKASYNISGYPPHMQVILNAMKTYGIILADNGSNWYVSGAPDEQWDNDMLHLLDDLTGNDFEAVDTSGLMVNYDSGSTGSIISGNTGIAGVMLSYTDGTPKTIVSQAGGDYLFSISNNWSGIVTPTHPCFTFTPVNYPYINVTTNQINQDYVASLIPSSVCVLSVIRANSNPTTVESVDYTVTFSGTVTGVDVGDFALTTTGVTSSSITNISGSGATYTVTVNTGFKNGTIRLDLVDDNTIFDERGNPLGGAGAGSGNFVSGEIYAINKTPTFGDVPFSHQYSDYVEILYANGYTAGCSSAPLQFCPEVVMNRAQAAVFIMRGNFGGGYLPPSTPSHIFADNWVNTPWAETWAEAMYGQGLTAGCSASPLKFCPDDQLTNAQAAVFGLRLKYGVTYIPPAASGTVFADMTDPSFWGAGWAEQAYADGLMPACGTSGAKPKFCPNTLVGRGFGAAIIVKAKNLVMP